MRPREVGLQWHCPILALRTGLRPLGDPSKLIGQLCLYVRDRIHEELVPSVPTRPVKQFDDVVQTAVHLGSYFSVGGPP